MIRTAFLKDYFLYPHFGTIVTRMTTRASLLIERQLVRHAVLAILLHDPKKFMEQKLELPEYEVETDGFIPYALSDAQNMTFIRARDLHPERPRVDQRRHVIENAFLVEEVRIWPIIESAFCDVLGIKRKPAAIIPRIIQEPPGSEGWIFASTVALLVYYAT